MSEYQLDPTSPEVPTNLNLNLILSAPVSPPTAFHSTFWFSFSFVLWIVLHIYCTPLYAFVADILHFLWKLQKRLRGEAPSNHVFTESSWGTRLTLAYGRLSTTKRAFWRRLLRSFIYYFFAVIFGFYFLLTYCHTIVDLYLVYTPGMDIAFCFAASHFLWCCIEDWPCRAHMGKTKCEQLAVFWGYIIHHVLTAAAYLMAVHTQQFASMCLMGLTFEGPVFFGCLREVVSLYDEDFNLFERVPPILLKINWICAFVSLIPCRYFSIGMFLYSAINWRWYLQLVSPTVRAGYWTFGSLFLLINVYFTWLLTYWYGQDQRYLKKKRRLQAMALEKQNATANGTHVDASVLSPLLPNNSPLAQSPISPASGQDLSQPVQRHAANMGAATIYPSNSQTNEQPQPTVQIVTHKP